MVQKPLLSFLKCLLSFQLVVGPQPIVSSSKKSGVTKSKSVLALALQSAHNDKETSHLAPSSSLLEDHSTPNTHSEATPVIIPLVSGIAPLPLDLYGSQPITVYPRTPRRTGGTNLTISGGFPGGFKFRPSEGVIIITSRSLPCGKLSLAGPDSLTIMTTSDAVTTAINVDIGKEISPGGEAIPPGGLEGEFAALSINNTDKNKFNATDPPNNEMTVVGDTAEPSLIQEEEEEVEYRILLTLPDVVAAFSAQAATAITAENNEDNTDTAEITTSSGQPNPANSVVGNTDIPPAKVSHIRRKSSSSTQTPLLNTSIDTISNISLTLLLDGKTEVPEEYSAIVALYHTLKVISLVNPKGGNVFGAHAAVIVDGLPDMTIIGEIPAVIRLSGESPPVVEGTGVGTGDEGKEKPFLQIHGVIPPTGSEVSFTLPTAEAFEKAGIIPILIKKVKSYFVEISIDGGQTFDSSETAILNIK